MDSELACGALVFYLGYKVVEKKRKKTKKTITLYKIIITVV